MLDFNKKTPNQPSSIVVEYLQALMCGNKTMLSEINGMKLANQQDSALLHLINKVWNDSSSKKENFSNLIAGLNTNNKVVAYLVLGVSAIAEGNIDDAANYVNKARVLLVGIKGILTEITNLILIHTSIILGEAKTSDFLKVITPTTEVTKGYFFYLQGLFKPSKSSNPSNPSTIVNEQTKQKYLRDAITTFSRINNLYLLALAQIKLAECEIEQSEAETLLSNSIDIFESLGRKPELELCQLLASKYSTTIKTAHRIGEIVYASEKMAQIKRDILRAASCNYPVLIMGPSGSGKELIAKAIHDCSKRFNKALVVANCGAIAQTLMQSELFGHVKGAFTGADRDRKGFVGNAETGTLFLDEIAELNYSTQTTLLRLIDKSEYQRVGSGITQRADVRIIAATNKNIEELAELDKAGKIANGNGFRHELLNRFTIKITVPALSERPEDILAIAEEILARENANHLSFDLEAKSYLQDRDYVYNVRELENIIRTAIIDAKMSKADTININMLKTDKENNGQGIRKGNGFNLHCPTLNYQEGTAFFEKTLLEKVIKAANSNIKKALEISGMTKSTLYRRASMFGISLTEG
jgi:DNA-binding NtrC family response regulator